jgi:integrase/recombinase XerD
VPDKDLSVGAWLERFISLGNNPRAARLIGDASPYSPATIELYRQHFGKHVKGDPFLDMKMVDVEESHALAFTARLGIRKTKDGRELAGTRTFEVVVAFVRMAFHEYWEEHQHWINPFDRIKAPKRYKGRRRDVLQESEILKLFMPGVITDVLEYAVCTAMFWVGLRRAEIFGLKTSDLDWKTPQIRIDHAWKLFGKKKNRTLGDPKWHKHREAPFPEELQAAIKKLQEVNGVHDFVFCYKDGGTPHGKWILEKMPKWMKAAGVDPAGRKIVPHSARHSLASTLEAAGVPLRYIQEMLGHASMKTTKVYLHTPEGKINELTKKISDLSKAEEEKKEAGEVLKISEYR